MRRRTSALTERQQQLLTLLREDDRRSIRELQALANISSTSVVTYNLLALERAGRIERGPRGQARRWKVVGQAEGRSAAAVVARAKVWARHAIRCWRG